MDNVEIDYCFVPIKNNCVEINNLLWMRQSLDPQKKYEIFYLKRNLLMTDFGFLSVQIQERKIQLFIDAECKIPLLF